ncbi:MAG TPA: TetR/AcrR family transcriptional regulator [Clostridia bacterium]|nr:TetR/AcrR family transcriptional regulator [Clostridia bacterium]
MIDKKAEILRCGKELFSSRGFKASNIAEITKMAGMATGTFYNYYPSKEKLFMEIYMDENAKLKKRIIDSLDLDAEPMQVMMEMLAANYEGMSSNPILKEWYNKDVFNRIERNFREENGLGNVDFLYESFIDVVKKWQKDGKMRNDIDTGMIMAIFASITNVDLHKEEIGLGYFPEVLQYIGEFVMKGLMDTSKG